MIRRAVPALVVLLAGFAGLFAVGREAPVETAAIFSIDAGTWMPHVNSSDMLTGSWFCPGVPASGEEGVGGEVIVSNRDSEELVGRFTVLTPEGATGGQGFSVAPWSRSTIDVDALV